MPEIAITERAAGTYVVEVTGNNSPTSHEVRVPARLAERIAGPGVEERDLVATSFEFLLEREPNTSILRTFSLEVIGDYFPEWPEEMKRRFSR
jgi:hypothetical protein